MYWNGEGKFNYLFAGLHLSAYSKKYKSLRDEN
jgi:hypothetical protein